MLHVSLSGGYLNFLAAARGVVGYLQEQQERASLRKNYNRFSFTPFALRAKLSVTCCAGNHHQTLTTLPFPRPFLTKMTQVGSTGVEVVAGTPLSLIASVEKWGTDVSAVSGMVVYRADGFRQVMHYRDNSGSRCFWQAK